MSRNRKPESEPSMLARRRAVSLPKSIEDVRQKLRVDADAGVRNDDLDLRLSALQLDLDQAAVTRALLTMCTAVYSWYRKDGPSTQEEIADFYAELARRMVGYEQAAPAVVARSVSSLP